MTRKKALYLYQLLWSFVLTHSHHLNYFDCSKIVHAKCTRMRPLMRLAIASLFNFAPIVHKIYMIYIYILSIYFNAFACVSFCLSVCLNCSLDSLFVIVFNCFQCVLAFQLMQRNGNNY